ncbi:hypothetical protein GOHSU_41_00130 [Gordonia hirsuta DSM 44140 = NBRC 16056]|uniref:DUF4878 domain-containing protein n=1 Tax=Gordonia hirsuta DSM 44140 = NBRC 16056 TaxID=1121927 RepID=L7LCN7_9ACTN|nr:hypothetical protein [Gordonia hirsuta]GAC58476.1 hypothetical protein GOHSU_41_00130 [Gordonia hirsuta DSM 44140 = NBRC 16056]
MPTSDNDKTSAVKKVVDAFRARRAGEQVPDDQAAKSTAPRTPVVKIEPGQALGGGGAEAPTQAFAVPAELTGSAGEVTEEIVTDEVAVPQTDAETEDAESEAAESESEADIPADEAPVDEALVDQTPTDQTTADETPEAEAANEAGGGSGSTPKTGDDADEDAADTGDAADAQREVEVTAGGISHETVVAVDGAGDRAEVAPRTAVESVHPDELERPGIVEQPLDLTPGDDATDTAQIALPEQAKTDTIAVAGGTAPAPGAAAAGAAAAAATAGAGATAAPADERAGEWSSTPHQPEVIAPTTPPAETKSRAKLGALLAALIALIVAGVLIWWFVFHTSPQNRAADAARTYQTAMNDGDLSKLQSITCGEEQKYYQSVSPEEFRKAFESQQARNQMMAFKNVTGVAVDGNTARVGVDVYSIGDPDVTTSAQITLHRIDGDWKVCDKP